MNIGEIAVLSEELERLKEENATLRQKLGDAEGREGCRTIRLDECGHIIREPAPAQTEGREDFDTWWDSPKRPAMRSSMTKEECRSVWEIANGTTPTDKPQEGAQA